MAVWKQFVRTFTPVWIRAVCVIFLTVSCHVLRKSPFWLHLNLSIIPRQTWNRRGGNSHCVLFTAYLNWPFYDRAFITKWEVPLSLLKSKCLNGSFNLSGHWQRSWVLSVQVPERQTSIGRKRRHVFTDTQGERGGLHWTENQHWSWTGVRLFTVFL